MEAILKFNIPEEDYEFRAAYDGMKWLCALHDMDEQLRAWLKHGHGFKSADEALQAVRDWLREDVPGAFVDR